MAQAPSSRGQRTAALSTVQQAELLTSLLSKAAVPFPLLERACATSDVADPVSV